MRVLHVAISTPDQVPGGSNRFAAELLGAQATAGVDARLVALDAGRQFDARTLHNVVYAASVEASLLNRLTALRRTVQVWSVGADVLDVHFPWHVLPALLSFRSLPPMVIHFHGPWADESAAMGARRVAVAAKRVIERLMYRRANALITLTRSFRDVLVDGYGVPADKVHVISPGVDNTRFTPGDRHAARMALGLPQDGQLIVAVRRLVPRMGLTDLVEAMPGVDARLLIVGTGPERQQILDRAAEVGVADRVSIADSVGDDLLPQAYRAADLSVVPSASLEGFGLVVLESLACGTPVVARAQGGLLEALEGFDRRSLVFDSSVASLATAIRAVLERPPTTGECVEFAASKTWASTAARTELVYRLAIDASARRTQRPRRHNQRLLS